MFYICVLYYFVFIWWVLIHLFCEHNYITDKVSCSNFNISKYLNMIWYICHCLYRHEIMFPFHYIVCYFMLFLFVKPLRVCIWGTSKLTGFSPTLSVFWQRIYTSAICTTIVTCDAFQRFAENAAPTALYGSCVFCISLKAIAGNNRSAYRTHVNLLFIWFIFLCVYDNRFSLASLHIEWLSFRSMFSLSL